MISENSYKKRNKCYHCTGSKKDKKVEKLVICPSKILIDINHTSKIENTFNNRRNNKNLFMYPIEDDEKKEIEEWKIEHI